MSSTKITITLGGFASSAKTEGLKNAVQADSPQKSSVNQFWRALKIVRKFKFSILVYVVAKVKIYCQ